MRELLSVGSELNGGTVVALTLTAYKVEYAGGEIAFVPFPKTEAFVTPLVSFAF